MRDEFIWDYLFKSLSDTYLFFKPNIILDNNHNRILYFCTTPSDKKTIREFITSDNYKKVEEAILLIFDDLRFKIKMS